MLTLLCLLISVLKKSRRRGRGWTRALGPEQLLRACEAITAGKGLCLLKGDVAGCQETQGPESFYSPFPKSPPIFWTQARGRGRVRRGSRLTWWDRRGSRSAGAPGSLPKGFPELARKFREMHMIPGWHQVKAGESQLWGRLAYPTQEGTSYISCAV